MTLMICENEKFFVGCNEPLLRALLKFRTGLI